MPAKPRHRQKKKVSRSPSGFQARYYRGDTRQTPSSSRAAWRRQVLFAILVAGALAGVWMFGRIETITVKGIDDQTAVRAIHRQLHRHYTFAWQPYTQSPENTIRYPANIADVTLSMEWADQRLVASVEKASPALLWATDGEKFVVDKHGHVTGKAGDSHQSLPVIIDDSGLPVDTEEQIAPEDFIAFVQAVEGSELPITRMRIVDTTRELYADLETGYYVRFDTTASAGSQIENVRRARQSAKRNGETITEYIDVRLPYKAYYK